LAEGVDRGWLGPGSASNIQKSFIFFSLIAARPVAVADGVTSSLSTSFITFCIPLGRAANLPEPVVGGVMYATRFDWRAKGVSSFGFPLG
jgi:hypothetical protein